MAFHFLFSFEIYAHKIYVPINLISQLLRSWNNWFIYWQLQLAYDSQIHEGQNRQLHFISNHPPTHSVTCSATTLHQRDVQKKKQQIVNLSHQLHFIVSNPPTLQQPASWLPFLIRSNHCIITIYNSFTFSFILEQFPLWLVYAFSFSDILPIYPTLDLLHHDTYGQQSRVFEKFTVNQKQQPKFTSVLLCFHHSKLNLVLLIETNSNGALYPTTPYTDLIHIIRQKMKKSISITFSLLITKFNLR